MRNVLRCPVFEEFWLRRIHFSFGLPTDILALRHLETKFLRLKTPVTIGSRFGDWEVSWLGGWTKHRFGYLVMVVRVVQCSAK
jgi:hypothetical protein